MKFNIPVISRILGTLLLLNAVFMFLCIPVAIFYNEGGLLPMAISAAITGSAGFLLRRVGKGSPRKELKKKDGYLVVSLLLYRLDLIVLLLFWQ